MLYLGDFKAGQTVYWDFDTEVNGLPSSISALTLRVYRDNNTATETGTGIASTIDADGLTGIVFGTVDLTADPLYAIAHDYTLILTGATLGGQTVRRGIARWSIENRSTTATLSAAERDAAATALLKLDWAGIAGEAARSVLNALRFLRNKRSLAGGTLTVTKEDDVVAAWTAVVLTSAGDPVSSVDPN